MSLHATTFQTKELCSTSYAVNGFLRTRRNSRRSLPTRVKAGSFDPNSDGETADLTAEFYRVAEPQRKEKLQQHLDLMVNVHESTIQKKAPSPCECCAGSGQQECNYCNGTGLMTVGDTLFCGTEGCRKCLICKGDGVCNCEFCRGTGNRAGWLAPGCQLKKP